MIIPKLNTEERIYLATPFSDLDPRIEKIRFEVACQIAADLIVKGHIVFSPIAHSYPIHKYGGLDGKVDFWWPQNKAWIDWCTEVWVADMAGRDGSRGIKREVVYAGVIDRKVVWL